MYGRVVRISSSRGDRGNRLNGNKQSPSLWMLTLSASVLLFSTFQRKILTNAEGGVLGCEGHRRRAEPKELKRWFHDSDCDQRKS